MATTLAHCVNDPGLSPGASTEVPLTSGSRKAGTSLYGFATLWLFPGLVSSIVLGNQPSLNILMFGQIIAWVNVIAAVLILLRAVRGSHWILLLVGAILISRGLRLVTDSNAAEVSYILFSNILFCSAGAVIVYRHSRMIYKQVMVVCLLNLIFMAFQVSGVAEASQLFTTIGPRYQANVAPTFLLPENRLDYLLVQGRPTGLSHSQVILTLILLYGLVLHLSREKGTVWWGTVVLSAMMVLAMAKIVFLIFLLIALWLLVVGPPLQRGQALKCLTLSLVFLALYIRIFPGMAAINLSLNTLSTSLFIRFNDIASVLGPDSPVQDVVGVYLAGTARASWASEGAFVSGYAQALQQVPQLIPGLAFGFSVLVLGLWRWKKLHNGMTTSIILTVIVIGIFPGTHPIWSTSLYWFIAGLGLLPVFALLRPRFLAHAIAAEPDAVSRPPQDTYSYAQ